MIIEVEVKKLSAKLIAITFALGISALLAFAALVNCTVGLLANPGANVRKELLTAGVDFVPNSALLNARLAEFEMSEADRDIQSVESRATRAVNLSPWDYRQRLLLATVKEAAGDRTAAEEALREAVALAPNYTEVHWRLANLLLREGKLARSVGEFRAAGAANPALLPGTLDLLWRVTAGNLAAVQAVTPRVPKSQLLLAQFLQKQSRSSDAITVFSGIDRNSLLAMSDASAFISSLITEGRIEEARGLWVGLVSGAYAQPGRPLPAIWNGSFESDITKNLDQFDWILSRNDYAVPVVDSAITHTGSRSLRIDFTGRDTTRIDGQIKQTVIVRPALRYRLECFVKTDRLETPEGPRIVVTDAASSTDLAKSEPISPGSSDWRPVAIDFTSPPGARVVTVAIKRIPKFSYDKPTSGTIWLDDFVLTELSK